MKKTLCILCNKEIRNNNIERHRKSHERPIKIKKIRGIDFDPNIGFKNGTRTIWNKGLTKETDERVRKNSENVSKSVKGVKRKPLSEEHKLKLSSAIKEYYRKFPEMHPNRKLAGNFKKMTYPEKLVYEYLQNLGLKPEHNKKVLSYFPDFIIENNINRSRQRTLA